MNSSALGDLTLYIFNCVLLDRLCLIIIAPVHDDFVADGAQFFSEFFQPFGRFSRKGGFVVVKGIFLSDGCRGEVRHYHVRPRKDSFPVSIGLQGRDGRCGWDEGLRMHEAEDGDELEGQCDAAVRKVGEGGVVMMHEGTDADHLRAKFLDEEKIFHHMVEGLIRTSHHDAGTGLIAVLLEAAKALQPPVSGHSGRMESAVMVGVEALVAQQIAIRPGLSEPFIGFRSLFSE